MRHRYLQWGRIKDAVSKVSNILAYNTLSKIDLLAGTGINFRVYLIGEFSS